MVEHQLVGRKCMGEDAMLSATHANSCVIEPAAALCETNNK